MTNNAHQNVLGSALQLFSKQPLTGFNRDGYCRVTAGDFGNHSVAGIVTEEFLDYSASQGRWNEAFEAFKDGKISKNGVPKVKLESTDQAALRKLSMKDLEEFKAE